ncbi:uncharacterized protein LOC135194816 [Vanessa tameamea]|uniref:Uncharacterized protein LOC135194816 n=1 Tax=Vanessa tameamea TaxID=334116 RepID=A0ABM4AZZ8_VANTA
MTQVLTGHGCFGKYLHGIVRREVSPSYHTAFPGTTFCGDLSLLSVINAMLSSEPYWSKMRSFCEKVMSQKEEAEREREVDAAAHPTHRRRPGKRKQRYATFSPRLNRRRGEYEGFQYPRNLP